MRFRLFLGVLLFIILITAILEAQSNFQFRTRQSGAWSDTETWEVYDHTSGSWKPASRVPSLNDTITIKSGDTVNVNVNRNTKANRLVIENGAALIINQSDTLTIQDSAELYDLNINGTLLNKGRILISGSGTRWRIGGTYIHNTGSAISDPLKSALIDTNSTVEYRDAMSNPPISDRTYWNLKFTTEQSSREYKNFSGTKPFTVEGTLTIGEGVTWTLPSGFTGAFNLKGNFIVDGVCNIDREVIIFSETSSQTITGSGQLKVDTLTIDNSAGVSLGPSITVIDSTLNFENGKLTIDPANAIKVISSITGAGAGKFVDGKLTYPVSSTETVPLTKKWETGQGNDYLPVTIKFTSLSGSGDVTVSVVDSLVQPPDGPLGENKVLRRYFKITQTGLTSFSADLTLSYSDADLQRQGITNESSLRVFQWDGASWRELTVTSRDLDNNTITVTGVTSFSDFVISGTGDAPLPVTLKSFIAKTFGNKIKLVIETSTELDGFLGFNIYRGDEPSKIDLVASYLSDERLKAKGSQAYGAVYEWEDINVKDGQKYYYKIGLVSSYGEKIYDKIIEAIVELPKKFVLYQNYPNPFNPLTTIEFDIAEDVDVRLEIFNLRGQKVAELINGKLEAGRYSVVVDFKDMPSGVYFYILRAGNFVGVKKMVLMK